MPSKADLFYLSIMCLAFVVTNLVTSLTDWSSDLDILESQFEIELKQSDTVETDRQITEGPRSLLLKGSNLNVKPKSDLKSLQNEPEQQNKDKVDRSKFNVKLKSDLNSLQNQPEQQNKDKVDRSKFDVQLNSDLGSLQKEPKRNIGDKVDIKLPQKRHLVTKRIIKKNKQKLSKNPGPLYSDRVINPYPFKITRNPIGCRSVSPPNGNVFVLILVACRHREVRDRSLIRKTWGKVKVHKGKSILVRFLVGLPHTHREKSEIEEEIAEYGDIIQGDFVDSYHNMTIKVLMGLKWAGLMCPNATYVMNMDSDMFVNVYNLVTLLANSPRMEFTKGNLKFETKPLRNSKTKWDTPLEMYPESTYPPYLNGPAYVMSGDLPGRIFNESIHVRYIPWDDVFIGLVMKKINVIPLRGSHFEDYPNLRSTHDVLNAISQGIATYVRHQWGTQLDFMEIWNNISRSVNHHH